MNGNTAKKFGMEVFAKADGGVEAQSNQKYAQQHDLYARNSQNAGSRVFQYQPPEKPQSAVANHNDRECDCRCYDDLLHVASEVRCAVFILQQGSSRLPGSGLLLLSFLILRVDHERC